MAETSNVVDRYMVHSKENIAHFNLKELLEDPEGADLQEQLGTAASWPKMCMDLQNWVQATTLAHPNIFGLVNLTLRQLSGGSRGSRSTGTAASWPLMSVAIQKPSYNLANE